MEATIGLFNFLGGLLGGGSQKKAADQATQALVESLNRGIDTQNAFNEQTRQDYLPYTEAGTAAIGKLGDYTGLNGTEKLQTSLDSIPNDPRYQALYKNGLETTLQNASATGGIRGGDTQRGLADFGSDTLAKVYQAIIDQFSGVAGLGVGAQGAVTGAGQNTANNVTALEGETGQAQANNFLAKGRINAQNWSNLGGFLDSATGAGGGSGGGGFSLASALKALGI